MAFVRVRKIKGRQYRYREERWREGGKVRSRSTCLGAVDGEQPEGILRRIFPKTYGIDWAEIERQELERIRWRVRAKQPFLARCTMRMALRWDRLRRYPLKRS